MPANTLFEQIIDALHVVPDFQLINKEHVQKIEFQTPYRIVFNGVVEIKTIKEEHRIAFFMCFNALKTEILTSQGDNPLSLQIDKGLAIDSTGSVYLIT